MVQLPYLQPFDDVNKRVSRLAANISLIKVNLSPLPFEEVPRELYTEAILGVYELKRNELLRDLFIWVYRPSALHYAAVRQSLGEPNPFRLNHRAAMRRLVGDVIREGMDKRMANTYIGAWAVEHVEEAMLRAGTRSHLCSERQLRGNVAALSAISCQAQISQCAPTARNTSGGRIHPDSCRFDLVADRRSCRVTGGTEAL